MDLEHRFTTRTTAVDLDSLLRGSSRIPAVLQQMSYPALRGGQEAPIINILGGRDSICILPTGCHARGQRILMHDGSVKRVEDIVAGDLLMGPDSTPRRVLCLCRGSGRMVRVVPIKGESFEVNEEHILTLIRTAEKSRPKYPSQQRAGEMVDVSVREWKTWSKWKKHIHKLVRVGVEFAEHSLPIDPYFVGVLLGDGGLAGGPLKVTKPDREIFELCDEQSKLWGMTLRTEFRDADNPSHVFGTSGRRVNPLRDALAKLGIYPIDSEKRFVPEIYKTAGRLARLEILAGLLDTDGHGVFSEAGYDFISKSEQLTNDVAFLARSLGYAAYPGPCEKSCQNGFTGTYYRVYISGVSEGIPLRIKRKQGRSYKQKKSVLRSGFDVVDLPEDDYYGFRLDGDGRYLLSDFTVTHNSGKTAIFVIPTLCLEWRTLVVSPLVSLMRDQLKGLQRQGVASGQMSGMQSEGENAMAIRQWAAGNLSLLYIAPERLGNEQFKQAISAVPPDMVVVDEAHVVSQWSDNFRPSYKAIGDFIVQHNPRVVAAFTATAPQEVERDIREVLGLKAAQKFLYYPRRSNLKLSSREYTGDADIAKLVQEIDGPTIIYCCTRKKTEELAAKLSGLLPFQCSFFHGDLPDAQKRQNQDSFMENESLVMCATNAFGMGVDKPDIRGVIHRDHPGSIEALSQEIGRSGRDGKDALCVTLRAEDSTATQRRFIELGHPEADEIRAVYSVYRDSVDAKGLVSLTGIEVGKKSGIWKEKVDACVSILTGSRVLERVQAHEKIARVQFVGNSEDPRFKKYKADITRLGLEQNRFWNFDLNTFVDRIGLGYPTVTGWLKDWDKQGLIKYIAPFRGATRKVIGDLSLVDFDRLKVKAAEAHRKLREVLSYFSVPDEQKHAFFEKYFEVHR